MSFAIFLRGGRDTLELSELVARYESAKLEAQQVEKKVEQAQQDLVEFYFSTRDLPNSVIKRNVSISWTNKEFSQILNKLKKYPGQN